MQNTAQAASIKIPSLESIRALQPQVEAQFETMDQERMVPLSLIEELRKLGLFRLAWPHSYGGFESDPMTQIKLLEEVSRMDGSLGWIATFAALTGFAAAQLDKTALRELFPTPDTVSAGQYAPVGRAERVPGGYKVTARWSFGSGCRHADVMTGGVTVYEDGAVRMGADGQPETRMVVFPKKQCTILLDTWDTIGLRGTGSHDYTVKDLFVPHEHTFSYFDPPRIDGPLYRYAPMFLFSHTPMPLGIARAAIDKVIELGAQKRTFPGGRYLREEGKVQESVAEAEALWGSTRSYVFAALDDMWDDLVRGNEPSLHKRAVFRLSLIQVTRAAKEVVSLMFDTAATTAVQRGNLLDRQMRDILTLSQHRIVQTKMYRPTGRIFLGLGSADPMF